MQSPCTKRICNELSSTDHGSDRIMLISTVSKIITAANLLRIKSYWLTIKSDASDSHIQTLWPQHDSACKDLIWMQVTWLTLLKVEWSILLINDLNGDSNAMVTILLYAFELCNHLNKYVKKDPGDSESEGLFSSVGQVYLGFWMTWLYCFNVLLWTDGQTPDNQTISTINASKGKSWWKNRAIAHWLLL